MATTRKRRPWHGDTVPATKFEPEGFPQWEHNSFTFEGEIERMAAISRNMRSAPTWARRVARVMALAMLVPFAVLLVLYLVQFAGI